MKTNENKAKNTFSFSSLMKGACFLALELIAILSFNLGNSYIFYSILCIIVALFLFLCCFDIVKKKFCERSFFALAILFIFSVCAFYVSNFLYDQKYVVAQNGCKFLAILMPSSIYLCGYLFSEGNQFSIKKLMIVIYTSLALITLINLTVTMIEFEPFYTFTYKGKFFYLDGAPCSVSVDQMAFALYDFKFQEVNIEYFSLFPFLLLTSPMYFFFARYKEDKKTFILFIIYALLGLFSLLTCFNLKVFLSVIIYVLISSIILIFIKYKANIKILKYILIVSSVAVSILFLVLVINSQTYFGSTIKLSWIQDLISSNSILNKLFNTNGYVQKINCILDGSFSKNVIPDGSGGYLINAFYKMFGFPTGQLIGVETGREVSSSLCAYIDLIYQTGTIGFILFIVFLIVLVKNTYYLIKDNSLNGDKLLIVSYIIGFISFYLLNNNPKILIGEETLVPAFLLGPSLVFIFLCGYIIRNIKKEGKSDEK